MSARCHGCGRLRAECEAEWVPETADESPQPAEAPASAGAGAGAVRSIIVAGVTFTHDDAEGWCGDDAEPARLRDLLLDEIARMDGMLRAQAAALDALREELRDQSTRLSVARMQGADARAALTARLAAVVFAAQYAAGVLRVYSAGADEPQRGMFRSVARDLDKAAPAAPATPPEAPADA